METDLIITLGIFFFCGALLTFWIKKRWKKAPSEDELKAKFRDGPTSEDEIGGKWTAEPEPPELEREPEPKEKVVRVEPKVKEPEPQKPDSREFTPDEPEPEPEPPEK